MGDPPKTMGFNPIVWSRFGWFGCHPWVPCAMFGTTWLGCLVVASTQSIEWYSQWSGVWVWRFHICENQDVFFWYKFALNSPLFFCQVGRGACQRFIVPSSHMYSNSSFFSFANLETYITNTKFRIFMSLETIGHIKHKNLWLRNDMVDFINKNWGRTETRLHVPIWVLVKKNNV